MITKQITPSGGSVRLSITTPTFVTHARNRAPWGSHAVAVSLGSEYGLDTLEPLQTVPTLDAVLKSGDEFTYFYFLWYSCYGGNDKINQITSYIPPGYGAPAKGEGFNLLMRPACFAKIPNAEVTAYLSGFGFDSSGC